MNQAAPQPTWKDRAGLTGVLIVLAFGIFGVFGGLVLAYWRMLHLHQDQQSLLVRELRGFHKELLTDLKVIADQSPAQATEDLCQVRFRIRQEDGWGIPTGSFYLELSSEQDGEFKILDRMESSLEADRVVNFGLVPPGNYRLTVTGPLEMKCHHDFRVIPGVPVDRAVLCPLRPKWIDHANSLPLRLKSVWPAEWKSQPLFAVYHLEAGSRRLGRWEWLPPLKRRFRHLVVQGNLAGPLIEERLIDALPPAFFEHPIPAAIVMPESESFRVPYDCCQVAAVTIVLDQTKEQKRYVYLGTFRFQGVIGDGRSSGVPGEGGIASISETAPHKILEFESAADWEIVLPREIVRQAIEWAAEELRGERSSAT